MTMVAMLVNPAQLDGFPGAPFPPQVVQAAAESVRDDAGWHIAPQITETVEVDTPRHGPWLLLPSLKVAEILSIVDVDGQPVEGWRAASAGRVWRDDGWPYSPVSVNMTHGYEQTPDALLPVIAARCQRALVNAVLTQRSETVGPRTTSEAYNINRLELEAARSGMAKYTLAGRVV